MRIQRDKLKRLLDKHEDVVLVEVLPREFYRKEHISRAINIPLHDIQSIAPKILDKNHIIVVYCSDAACNASERAYNRLKDMGYLRVYEYAEGKMDWKQAGLPMGRL